jgi:transcriptional/translational regulatory protein YebC/TACO1
MSRHPLRPQDVWEGAIRRAVEGKEGAVLETILYEGTGPAGTAFMVECLTDKRTRTGPAMRHIFTKYGGDLGATGSVAWQFQQTGVVVVDLKKQAEGSTADEDTVMMVALDAGATDVKVDEEEGLAEVYCPVQATHSVKQALEAAKAHVQSSAITRFASVRSVCLLS